tara:strand:- start:1064 stop:2251 length:1188 start_codon:yes stop_codon:yes gene_type:complete
MAAITAAEQSSISVLILESGFKPLRKVLISGGGRCNVTNACSDTRELINNYPRGGKPLFGLFHRFSTLDSVEWFQQRGLDLVTEQDGRIFPFTNSSKDVINCLKQTAQVNRINSLIQHNVVSIKNLSENKFIIKCSNGKDFLAKKVLISTGDHPSGRKLASILGHTIVQPTPSIFAFNFKQNIYKSCSGISINNVHLQLSTGDKTFKEKGRILITHKGISGPATLRISAFAARELYFSNYQSNLRINWIDCDENTCRTLLNRYRHQNGYKSIAKSKPFQFLPWRFWHTILENSQIDVNSKWAEIKNSEIRSLEQSLIGSECHICSRVATGEEFVTAGGIDLKEIDLNKMESKICPGLYFAGELINIDGVTGGFNFQHCWTSGWLAGMDIASNNKV